MNGRVIDDDMLGIARRLKSIDDGYFIFHNYVTGKFEVHDSRSHPNTLCLVLPYDRLDERTVRRVRYTRAERIASMIADMERDNARREEQVKRAAEQCLCSAAGG